MAEIGTLSTSYPVPGVVVYTWSGLTGAGEGKPVLLPSHSDKSVQFFGSHGGATTKLQGTNESTGTANYASLTDTTETEISTTSDTAPTQVLQNPLWVRPQQAGGAAGNLTCVLVCKKG